MPIIYVLAMVIVLGCGINVLWINSRRLINQIFAGICFICVLYFAFTLVSRFEANRYLVEHVYRGLPWMRLTWTTMALMGCIYGHYFTSCRDTTDRGEIYCGSCCRGWQSRSRWS